MLENVGEAIDTVLYPLLEKQYFKVPGGYQIKLGKNAIEFDLNFRSVMR